MNPEAIRSYLSNIRLDPALERKMLSFRRIVGVSPHPDDMEFAAGGFLQLARLSGAEIMMIVVSDGRKGTLDQTREEEIVQTRRREQTEAASLLGIGNIQFMGFRDSEIPEPRAIRGPLMGIIRSFRPDLVISLDPFLPYESHLDHVRVGEAVMESVLLHSHPGIGDGSPQSPRPCLALAATSNPNVVVNVDTAYPTRSMALNAHASQLDAAGYAFEALDGLLRMYGSLVGAKYGEPYRFLEGDSLHMNPLAGL